MAVQLAVDAGATVIATASRERARPAARARCGAGRRTARGWPTGSVRWRPSGVDAAIDTVGTDEAVDVSLELVADRQRIATIAAFGRAPAEGIKLLGGGPGR